MQMRSVEIPGITYQPSPFHPFDLTRRQHRRSRLPSYRRHHPFKEIPLYADPE